MNGYNQTALKSLLAESLCEKQGSYLIEELFQRFPTTSELVNATEHELTSIKGVGRMKARQIVAALKLAQLLSSPPLSKHKIRTPQDIYKLMEAELRHLNKEYFVVLYLDSKNGVINKEVISIGSLNACIVHPREVFRPAIKRSAASIVCVHNHPSGDPEPSPEDIEITKRLASAGNIIGIDVIDHVVIGHYTYVSLKERGFM